MSTQTNVADLSVEELRAALAEKEKAEKQAREREKNEYENKRDAFVKGITAQAIHLHVQLREFKEKLHKEFDEHQERLNAYGEIRSNSKGGFSITTKDGKFRARRIRSTTPSWDERSAKALELLSEFLADTVKKRDKKLYEILITFIQRNEKGELEYSKVMHLLQHKDKYSDPRWLEGLALIQESYNIQLRGYGYEFFIKDEKIGAWEKVEINFTAL